MLDFAITGIGRCRTAWMAAFLTDGDVHCLHEFAWRCRKPEDFVAARVPGKITGVADTLIWLADSIPARRTLVIHRDPSFAETFSERVFGVKQDFRPMAERLRRVTGIHVEFDELDDRMEEIVWLLTGKDIDETRFDLFRRMKIEVVNPVAEASRPMPEYWRTRLCLQ